MNWEALLSTQKLGNDEKEPEEFSRYPMNEFEKDYNKIVSSSAFRRLQDKTQVFPLDKSDFIRTRLTHSIEVSTVARQLGIMLSKNRTQYRPADINAEAAEGISSVLLCAGFFTIWGILLSAILEKRPSATGSKSISTISDIRRNLSGNG